MQLSERVHSGVAYASKAPQLRRPACPAICAAHALSRLGFSDDWRAPLGYGWLLQHTAAPETHRKDTFWNRALVLRDRPALTRSEVSFASSGGPGRVAFLATGRAEHSSNGLCLLPNLVRVLRAPPAWNETFEFVTVGDNDEHLVNQIMGEHAMGLIQMSPLLPRIFPSSCA
jgi:hypothetical protein